MYRRRLSSVIVLVASCASACAFGLDGYTGGGQDDASPSQGREAGAETSVPPPAITSDGGAADAASDGGTPCLANGRGPDMVLVGDDAGIRFCIDSTEVTNDHYRAFVSAGVPTTQQPTVCAWNTSYVPADRGPLDDTARGRFPVVEIDWCDARAFCAWAGKHLCGRIGGGAVDVAQHADPHASQTTFVCTHAGAHPYPYGEIYQPGACNGDGNAALEPPETRTLCNGGFSGVYDLIGNVGEWNDDCEGTAGADDSCPDNASSFLVVPGGPPTTSSRCDHFDPQRRSDTYQDLGFRCCFD